MDDIDKQKFIETTSKGEIILSITILILALWKFIDIVDWVVKYILVRVI